MCATSWCDLDLTFDLAYLMLFYVSMRIILILSYLSYISHIFVLESWLLHLWVSFGVRLSTVKVIRIHISFTFATSHCNGWYSIK